ncbi:Retrovirus-related Pol polyprotein from transposon 17.6-like Protein [Tribolium castaneum]|uniref:Retrovirus-related Pol polyprotein from transposon 17.6-like Protein n=1 Tax=Tribolium castaneum TaxID=7070 RepID=A0A139W9E0_TRICA|nr:Retrovirus-related Pol polyprotein from transposon 17.6-like Protein [Tribolium castaneum]
MTFSVILGRDFLSFQNLKISFGKTVQIDCVENREQFSEQTTFHEILHINIDDDSKEPKFDLNVNPCLPLHIKLKLNEMYEESYRNHSNSVGLEPVSDFEMNIALKNDQPIAFRPRRLSFFEKEKLRVILNDLEKDGVIRPSKSPYCSPIVLVRKKNGEIRLCVDYRELNKITVRDNYPTPLIDDHLDMLKNKRYFSCLDLKNGFHHVRMAPSSIKYTSFVTPLGQYEFLKMPFGLTNAPHVFQRYIHEVFSDLINSHKILVYLDDIMIATEDLDEHLSLLREVFDLAATHKLEFRLDKCMFLNSETIYLGYLINEKGIRPNPENVKAMVEYPIPRNPKELHS